MLIVLLIPLLEELKGHLGYQAVHHTEVRTMIISLVDQPKMYNR